MTGIKVIVESDGWRWAKYGRKPTENTVRHYYKVRSHSPNLAFNGHGI